MPEFRYRAAFKNGKIIRGILIANDKTDAVKKIKSNSLQVVYLKRLNRKKRNVLRTGKDFSKNVLTNKGDGKKELEFVEIGWEAYLKPITPKDVITFTNNLYLLKKSNFHNTQALALLLEATENPIFKEVIEDIMIGVDSGENISAMMEYYPKIFPPLYTNIIKVGETTGDLTNALEQARRYIEDSTKITKKIRSIVIPRIIQFIALILLLFAGLLFGVPMIQKVYDMFGSKQSIPKATQFAVNSANFLIQYWYVWTLTIGIIGLITYILYKTPLGRYRIDKFILKLPIFGKLMLNLNTEKFFNALLLNLKSGIRMQEGLGYAQGVLKNRYLVAVIEECKANIAAGNSWVTPLEETGIFPKMTTEMLNIGMQTDITEIIEKVNEYTDIEVQESIQKLIKSLPEITYLAVGIILIIFTLTIMVPLVDVYMGNFLYNM